MGIQDYCRTIRADDVSGTSRFVRSLGAAGIGTNHLRAGEPGDTSKMDWTTQAACRETDPDELFVQGAAQNRVKNRCFGCAVRMECLSDALDNRIEFGVWGGMTERERRALLRRRPNVKSWRTLLEAARDEHLTLQRTG
jgi:WhiB family transcriptional regulator, redox-sensing transcriptional regulator